MSQPPPAHLNGAPSRSSKGPLRRVGPDEVDPRPEILLGPNTHQTTEAMLAALLADEALYQRTELVHVLRDEGDGEPWTENVEDWRAPGTPLVRKCPVSWLTDRVSMHARCLRRSKGGESFRHVEPPKGRVTAVLERGEWAGIRPLETILEAPSLRPDGSLLQEPGYDRRTRSLYLPNTLFPRVPDAPSQGDAVLAYSHLADVFADFPYVTPAHRSAVIAAVLTLLARPAIRRSCPAWCFDASASRSGKSLQTDVISAIVFGRMASRTTYPENDEELEKVLGGYAQDGARLVNFDNVARRFGGAPLDKCITATDRVSLRVLGKTGQPEYPWRAIIFASGNNLECRGDMLPRVIAPRLESPLENPETRADFRHPDLRAYALKHRASLVVDALTLLRAYVVAGRPDVGTPKWGGFEDWSSLIAPALVWVGAADPMGARRGLAGDEDPTRRAEGTVVAGWDALCRSAGVSALTVKGAIAQMYPAPRRDEPPDGLDEMREAIEELTGARQGLEPSSQRMGRVVRHLRGRPIGGRKMVEEGKTGGVGRWRTVSM